MVRIEYHVCVCVCGGILFVELLFMYLVVVQWVDTSSRVPSLHGAAVSVARMGPILFYCIFDIMI